MTPTNPRLPLRWSGVILIWLLALWPCVLWLAYGASPELAVGLQRGAEQWVGRVGLVALLLLVVAAAVYPPTLAMARLQWHRLTGSMRADRDALLKAQVELQHLDTPARQLEVGRLALALGEPRLAMGHLQNVLAVEPEHTAARYQLAQALFAMRQLPAAHAELARVVASDPGHAFGEALQLLGWLHHLLGDDQGAAALLRRHQQEHGGNRRSHYWLAVVLEATGDRQGAAAALRVAAAPPDKQRLTAEENWYRAKARVRLWHFPRAS